MLYEHNDLHVFMVVGVHIFGLLTGVTDSDHFVKVLSQSCSLCGSRAWWVSSILLYLQLRFQIHFYSHIMKLLAWQVYRRGDKNECSPNQSHSISRARVKSVRAALIFAFSTPLYWDLMQFVPVLIRFVTHGVGPLFISLLSPSLWSFSGLGWKVSIPCGSISRIIVLLEIRLNYSTGKVSRVVSLSFWVQREKSLVSMGDRGKLNITALVYSKFWK